MIHVSTPAPPNANTTAHGNSDEDVDETASGEDVGGCCRCVCSCDVDEMTDDGIYNGALI